ncbi:MAG TPA: pitrilysin family protein [Gammaproteobacteria bacterium]|nr:pitrilysin family protein [Gammaproteobacteria bacterium]
MYKLLRCTTWIVALALAACSTAPTSSSNPLTATPKPAAAKTQVTRATLKNGLKVVIVRDPLAPVAAQQITYRVGANEAPAGFPGMAHAQEHMMFRGSPGLTGDQLSAIYARMGGALNAYTTNSITSYFFLVPAGDVDVALRVGAIRMSGVNNTEADWQKERGAIEQEVARDKSTPFYLLYEKLLAHMFAGTPYAHDALGTKASFDKTTGAMLKQFHEQWYAPNNALLVVTGNVDPQAVLAKVKAFYGSIPAKKVPEKLPINLAPVKAATFTTPSDQPYGIVLVAFRMPGYRSADYPAAELASHVLSSQRGPIAALRYEGKALAAGFEMQTMPEAGIGFAYAIYPPGGDANAVRQALVAAITNVRKNGISADLVAAAKRRAVLDQELQRNSIFGLAQTWTDALALAGLDSPAEELARLRKVTPAAVNVQVTKTLNLAHAITLIAKPTPGAKPKSGQGFGGTESFGSKPQGPVTLPDWAAQALARLPSPKPFLRPVDMRLDNGLRLIVQPLKISHSVSLYGAVDENEDMQAPEGQKGVSDLLATLFDWGPKGMNRLQFEAAQDKIGADLSVGPNFSLSVLPQYFDDGVRLLADDLLHPALPAQAFKMQQTLLARQAAGQLASPQFQFGLAVQQAMLPKSDPALRISTAKSVHSLTPAKLETYYKKVYRPDETTIVVIGDVTPASARQVVEKYFGAWKGSGAKPQTDYPPVPLSKATRVFVPDPVKKQNQVVLAETLNLNFTDPDHFALDLANDLLSGGFYASPLFRVLREKLGLVYNVNSQFSFKRHRGSFQISYGSYPDKVEQARQAAIKVLEQTIAQPLSDEQLHLAKSIGLRRIELSKQSVDAIGQTWLQRSQDGLPLDHDYIMARYFEQVDAAEMQRALKKYVDPARLSTVILGQPVK